MAKEGAAELSVTGLIPWSTILTQEILTLLHSKKPKFQATLAFLSAIGLNGGFLNHSHPVTILPMAYISCFLSQR